jgi:tight adherence protein B
MMLLLITVLVFFVTAGLMMSAAYFWIQVPAARRQMRTRLETEQARAMTGEENDFQIVHENILSPVPVINRLLLKAPLVPRLQLFLTQAAVQLPLGTILLMCVSLFLFSELAGLVFAWPFLLTFLIALGAAAVPFIYIAFKRSHRLSKFEELFPDAIDLLARAVRAGHAFTTGFSLIATEMPEPIAGEFKIAFDQQNLGLPLAEALRNLSIRVPVPDVRIFLAALNIQRESGGNLGEVLDNLSQVIRERFKLLRQVKVFTAEGRLSMYVLTGMPPAFAVFMYFANPAYIGRLFEDPIGHEAIAVGVILQVFGYLVIRKVVQIKV